MDDGKETPLVGTLTGHTSGSGLSFWQWRATATAWILLEDRSEEGFHPGAGPLQPGVFDGQVIRWASVPGGDRA